MEVGKINPAIIIAGILSALNSWQRRHQLQSSMTVTGSGGSPSRKYNFKKASIRRKMARESRRRNRK